MDALHVIDGRWARDESIVGARELIRAEARAGGTCDSLLLGGSDLERRAVSLGLATTERIAPAGGRAHLAQAAIRRYLHDRAPTEVIACWSPDAARLVRAAMPRLTPVLMSTCDIGAAQGVRARLPAPALPPIGTHAGEHDRRRHEVREHLEVGPGATLIVPLASDDRTLDAYRLAFMLTLIETSGVECAVAMPIDATHARRTRRLQRIGLRPLSIRWTGFAMGSILEAADLAISPEERVRASWLAARAQALGVPVVFEGLDARDPALPAPSPELPSCVSASGVAPELARVLIGLIENADARVALARAQSAHATDPVRVHAIEQGVLAMGGEPTGRRGPVPAGA